ncbi:Iron binding protein SufA for iron-sulfur cluster assembly [Nitrincola lacisaponensis]|uniref:Iron binding protein SufA for iron-sulfur cluster assembly n=1 Tax=Nitrincola lacisaponensis TaxID=267850 RepID=A0A063Y881_9GAMM|nr:iron-sulfur cluster assembly accessory protein [Nitrincola lacisaponensis]KDE40587.1 Iron binding protein SufA for iron-sulfur cluster assembly [Nitrincola lacisaponensis]
MSVEQFDPATQAVTLLPDALVHFRKQLQAKPEATAIRLSVKPSGCSGFMYVMDLVESPQDEDLQLQVEDVRLLIDKGSLPILSGTEIDYVREGINRQVKFINPNATSECGCGESFTVND